MSETKRTGQTAQGGRTDRTEQTGPTDRAPQNGGNGSPKAPATHKDDFLAQAGHDKQGGLFAEFLAFMRDNKAWWMAPILIVLGLVGVLLILGATGAAPFLYTLW